MITSGADAVLSLSNVSGVPRRVELQKMTIVRPPADIARYTMVFHKRDSGNEINKDRSVEVEMGIMILVWAAN